MFTSFRYLANQTHDLVGGCVLGDEAGCPNSKAGKKTVDSGERCEEDDFRGTVAVSNMMCGTNSV